MNKLYVVSDIHSFFTPFKKALDDAGFNPEDKTHWLIVLGDAFDRGPESIEVFKYLMTLERKVLVKGNHDTLLEDLCMREYPYYHDTSNGTVQTVLDLGGAFTGRPFDACCSVVWNKMARYRELLVNYFETENYIFVHSWIPMNVTYDKTASKPWHQKGKTYSYKEDWRNANDVEWEEAMWGNPFYHAQDGLNQTGKTIVFGHWHCSLGHAIDNKFKIGEFEPNSIWEPYYNKEQGIIGIDRCTAHTGEVNVLVLEDEFLNNHKSDCSKECMCKDCNENKTLIENGKCTGCYECSNLKN